MLTELLALLDGSSPNQKVSVKIPRFKMEQSLDLEKEFADQPVRKLFSQADADLSGTTSVSFFAKTFVK